MVQALAGLTRAGAGAKPYEQALALFEKREGFSFSWLWLCSDDVSLSELSLAAQALGRPEEAASLRRRAAAAGSPERAASC